MVMFCPMRKRFEAQLNLGQTPIELVSIPLKSRDELPPTLAGLQWIFSTPEINEQVFELLEQKVIGNKKHTGRPGMDLWQILVLGVCRMSLDCDYDRLEDMANHHSLVRQIMGLPVVACDGESFHHKTLSENVCHVDEQLLGQINEIVVLHGRKELKKNVAEKILVKTDSYVLETNVHFPTDINLLWDAARKSIDLLSWLAQEVGLEGWRKAKNWKTTIKGLMRQLQQTSRGGKNRHQRQEKAAKNYLRKAKELGAKVSEDIGRVDKVCQDPTHFLCLEKIRYFALMLEKHIDLVERRIVKEETIPHEEKVFSLFEPHTEWIAKGKMRPSVELGHKVLVSTDQHGLILDYKVMEKTTDNQELEPLVLRLVNRFGEGNIHSLSMDKGFSDMSKLEDLKLQIPEVVMPKKGRRNKVEEERETSSSFKRLKRRHAAIESNINELEHHGLNRCPDKGLSGYKRYVGFGVLAYNLHRIGRALIEKQRQAAEQKAKAA